MNERKINRRDFIKGTLITGAGLVVGGGLIYVRRALAALLAQDQGTIDRAICDLKLGQISEAEAQAIVEAYMMATGPGDSRVVHVHDSNATNWDFSSGWYGDAVNQAVVDDMVERGLKALTGADTLVGAWQVLLPSYQSGEKIAIKVNFNNCSSCDYSSNVIDGLIHPVNGLVRGLEMMGVARGDIVVFDAIRRLPDRFRNRCDYPGVQFYDKSSGGCADNQATFVTTTNSPSKVSFSPPVGVTVADEWLTEVVMEATYVINMPIVKDHGISGVTMGFKNHFGTIQNPAGLHALIEVGGGSYRSDYNPMVDIYLHPSIRDKTILIVGDGLYGAVGNTNVSPTRWSTFDNDAPNSLFFSRDPVAADCVMTDVLYAEPGYHPKAGTGEDDYLKLAAAAGLGTWERGDPWQEPYGSGYSQIEYVRI